jgi:hypothetical protein
MVWDGGGGTELKTNPGPNGTATSAEGWMIGILEAWRMVPSSDATARSSANSAESCKGWLAQHHCRAYTSRRSYIPMQQEVGQPGPVELIERQQGVYVPLGEGMGSRRRPP